EGGIIVTNREEYYERACLLAHYERLPALAHEEFRQYNDLARTQAPTSFGFKYRIHPLASAISRVQLRHLDEGNRRRQAHLGELSRRIREIGGEVLTAPYEEEGVFRTWLGYMCQYFQPEGGPSRDRLVEALRAEGLPANGGRAGYLPVYWNPLYQGRSMWAEGAPFDGPYAKAHVSYEVGTCPQAEQFFQRTVGLPVLHRDVSPELLDEIACAVAKVIQHLGDLA
ncbi:MAG: hypothetical protein FJX77_11115, partial [Armatimonadetes bacterium]|nr:hypothetical protein [Armatimonadota bacterium]